MARCENFKIILVNDTDAEIKVKKFEYEDGSKWKTENMLGLDGHEKIQHGKRKKFTRNLGGIGNEKTCFRVTYSHHIGGTKWGSNKVETTGMFLAQDNGKKEVFLTK
ncbi:MAG: hypothetical protein PVH37_24825 [Desulfobacterales bacterium]|jgi:hypothetical protein